MIGKLVATKLGAKNVDMYKWFDFSVNGAKICEHAFLRKTFVKQSRLQVQ